MELKEVAPLVVILLASLGAFYLFWTERNDTVDNMFMLQIVLNIVIFLIVTGLVLNYWLDVDIGEFANVAWMAVYTGFLSYVTSLLYTGILKTTGTSEGVALHSTLLMQLILFVVYFVVATFDKLIQQQLQMLQLLRKSIST